MVRSQKTVTLRPVGNRKKVSDISQEPEMKKLIEVDHAMTEEEKTRTDKYLTCLESNNTL
jgi:hypothetical protein